jgi:hypothetical protein
MTVAVAGIIDSDTVLLNVAIIPSAEVSAAAVMLSQALHTSGGIFQLDGVNRFAHLTLYMSRFARSELVAAKAALSAVSGSLNSIRLTQNGYFVTSGGYYEISYLRSPSLLNAHDKVTRTLRTLRFSPGHPPVENYFGIYSRMQQENARKTGYDLAGDLYRPHITLTRFDDVPDVNMLPTAKGDLSFMATRIGLFQADSMGAARKLIAEFDLDSTT